MYFAEPIAGTLIAVGSALVLRGCGGDVISRAAGSGVLDERALAAKAELPEETVWGSRTRPQFLTSASIRPARSG